MYSWGQCENGQLGLGGIPDVEVSCPKFVSDLSIKNSSGASMKNSSEAFIKAINAGNSHSMILSSDGKVYTCGSNEYGQLGHEQLTQRRFGQVSSLGSYNIQSISCGSDHSYAVDEWGKVFSWGSDSHGQLGHNLDKESLETPKIIRGLGTVNVIQVSAGDHHGLALTRGSKLYAWGSNDFGQLGNPTFGKKASTPQLIECLIALPIRCIASGGDHSVIVTNSGAVYAWGKNEKGQLGLGDTVNREFPSQIRSLRNLKVCYVSCGAEHTVCLTEDGGVFSFGSGQYGQLGHGSKTDENLPRKIMELMGTEVSQIACGKKHTLALVPSRGRLYSFGLGGCGQLGNNSFTSATNPQVVHGPWIGQSENSSQKTVSVHCIGAGGDQSYASVCDPKLQESFDFRNQIKTSSIETLSPEILEEMLTPKDEDALDQDFMEKLEVIFQHPACLNASFLLPSHKPCTSKNGGINIEAWKHATNRLDKLKNETIKGLVTTGLSKYVLPKLENNPPDVETLRQFITLPLFNQFSDSSLYKDVHCPFSKGFISLPKAAWNVVEKWVSNQNKEYFQYIVQNYKKTVVHILNQKSQINNDYEYETYLSFALVFLRIMNRINSNNNCIVSYEEFYIPEIGEHFNLAESYMKWLMAKSKGFEAKEFHICNFPFVFDASAKTSLMQSDQAFQMHNAAHQASIEAQILSQIVDSPYNEEEAPYLICSVRRDHLVEDTLTFVRCQSHMQHFKKPLKVRFDGEEGDDAGGVRKEFFLLLLKEILDPKYGMFKEYEETQTIWFHPNCFEDIDMFFMIGVLCGLAIYNFTIIYLPFPLAIYKKLLGEDVGSIKDVEDLSPALAKGLRDLLAYEENDLEDVFSLNFAIIEDVFGETKTKELKPNGENISVTRENREEYVKLYCDYMLNKSVDRLYQAFHAGFHKVCGGRVLDLFHSRELEALVVGTQKYDWEEFENQADYKNGYDKDHPTIKWFWEVFHELTKEDKKKFLLFLTGTDRIPILGMTDQRLTIQKTSDHNYLPVAHTCFNLLDLPEYTTKEKLKYKLLQAINGTQGFGLV